MGCASSKYETETPGARLRKHAPMAMSNKAATYSAINPIPGIDGGAAAVSAASAGMIRSSFRKTLTDQYRRRVRKFWWRKWRRRRGWRYEWRHGWCRRWCRRWRLLKPTENDDLTAIVWDIM